jgi:hypothetical protein
MTQSGLKTQRNRQRQVYEKDSPYFSVHLNSAVTYFSAHQSTAAPTTIR